MEKIWEGRCEVQPDMNEPFWGWVNLGQEAVETDEMTHRMNE